MSLPLKYEKVFGNGHSFERVMPLKAVDLMKRWEGEALLPYMDNDGHWHQGYGHGPNAGPPVIVPGQPWTKEYATQVLMDDIAAVSRIVDKWVTVPITSYMFGALVSLAYNCGPTTVKTRSKVFQKLEEGNYTRAATEFLNLNKVKITKEEYYKLVTFDSNIPIATLEEEKEEKFYKILNGLTHRRACEIECFDTQVRK